MTHDRKSTGGPAAPASAQESGIEAVAAAARLGLSLAGAIDISMLAIELLGLVQGLYAEEGNRSALVASVLAERIEVLANGVCSALDDLGTPVRAIEKTMFRHGCDNSGPGGANLLAAIQAQGVAA